SRKSSSGAGSTTLTASSPRGICFDLDGVLIDSMPLHAQAWQEALATFGIRVPRLAIYEWEGEPGIVSARTLLRRRFRRPTGAQIAGLLRAKERRFKTLGRGIRVLPPLQRLLGRLKHRGLGLALVTGTSADVVRRVVPANTRNLFDTIVTGDRVRHGKPHPEPYLTAMRRLGLPRGRVWV